MEGKRKGKQDKMNLAVIFGGKSTEHEVSRLSAVNVLKALEGDQYEVFVIGITKEGRWYITKAPYEAIADGSWEKDPGQTSRWLFPTILWYTESLFLTRKTEQWPSESTA